MNHPHNNYRQSTRRRPARAGLTLLELILALALSVLVVVAVSIAINFHLKSLDASRGRVQEAQLARAVLNKISDDLRGAVYYEPLEPPTLASSQGRQPEGASEDGGGGNAPTDPAGGNDPSATDPLVDDLALTDEETEEETTIAESTAVMSQPGLIGNQYELQIDVSRLPRVDQYQSMVFSNLTGELVDIPSDVKTVAYYVRQQADAYSNNSGAAGLGGNNESFLEYSGGIGLVRRELDYSVTNWSAESGQTQPLDQSGRLFAPEVTYLEFRYFDGTEWLTEWSSEEMGGLPKAVEIVIVITSQRKGNQANALRTSLVTGQQTNGREYVYRKVVHLPSSVAPSIVEEEETEDLGL